jgi:hypothetical protein
MPKRENFPSRIGIAVVSDTALTGPKLGKLNFLQGIDRGKEKWMFLLFHY